MVGGPKAGRNAVIEMGSTAIGKLRNVRFNVAVKLIKDYSNDQRNPEVLEASDESYTFSAEKMWVDSDYVTAIKSQAAGVTITIYPAGKTSGEMSVALGDAIFTRYQFTADRDGVSAESVEGEAKTLTPGVYSNPA